MTLNIEGLRALASRLESEGMEVEAAQVKRLIEKAAEPEGVGDLADDLPPWQPGLLDLNSPDRLGLDPAEIKKSLDEVWADLPPETQQDIGSAIQDYIGKLPQKEEGQPEAEKPETLSDEEAMSAIEKAEREKGVVWAKKKDILNKLANMADRLDKIGSTEEANLIDGFIAKYATDLERKEEADTEQSKRYDSKHHHSLQVREPKTKQERIDREGREQHHVSTMQTTKATALSTRYCPEHVGAMLARVGESTYQCSLDGQIYNWEAGWTDYDGNEHPGGSVAAQTPDSSGYAVPHRIFDSRENITNKVN